MGPLSQTSLNLYLNLISDADIVFLVGKKGGWERGVN